MFGCGDDDDETPDAAEMDAACVGSACFDAAPPPDAGLIDSAPIDAPPPIDAAPTAKATMSIQEIEIVGAEAAGQGLFVNLYAQYPANPTWMSDDAVPALGTGCYVWDYTNIATTPPPAYQNFGTVTMSTTDGDPVVPPCVYAGPASYYACLGKSGTGGTIVDAPDPAPPGVWLFVSPGANFATSDANNYLAISGAATAGNNGAVPIIGTFDANTLMIYSATAAEELALPGTATWQIVAGVGPIPTLADPGMVEDDDVFSISLDTTGATAAIPAFTNQSIAVGPDFALTAAAATAMTTLSSTTGDMTLDCEGGCPVPTGLFGKVVTIDSTDTPVTGLSPFDFPAPTTHYTTILCVQIGPDPITVPAEALAFLSGATRIRSIFYNDAFVPTLPQVTLIAGHAKVAFSTPE